MRQLIRKIIAFFKNLFKRKEKVDDGRHYVKVWMNYYWNKRRKVTAELLADRAKSLLVCLSDGNIIVRKKPRDIPFITTIKDLHQELYSKDLYSAKESL